MVSADVVVIALGWIIPGIITLLGVLLVSWYRERSRQKHDDQVTIYEPLHAQMVETHERGYLYKYGGGIEAFKDDFSSIVKRAALRPKRHTPLREDIERLISLRKEAETRTAEFRRVREAALEDAAGEIELLDEQGSPITLATIFGEHWSSHEFTESISSGDKERFYELVDNRVRGAKASVPETQESPSEIFYRQARLRMRDALEAYNAASTTVLDQATRIEARLGHAMLRGRLYKR